MCVATDASLGGDRRGRSFLKGDCGAGNGEVGLYVCVCVCLCVFVCVYCVCVCLQGAGHCAGDVAQ
jgi:hypothetical protein